MSAIRSKPRRDASLRFHFDILIAQSRPSAIGQVRWFWCVVLPSPGGAALAGIQVGYSPARPSIRLKLFRRRQRSQAWNTAADAAAPHAGPTARSFDADHARSPSRFLLHEAAAIGGRRLSCDPAEDARKSALVLNPTSTAILVTDASLSARSSLARSMRRLA